MRSKVAALVAAMLLILCAVAGTASAEATLSASTSSPVTGQQISFDVGTTLRGLEAVISTTGLSFVSNTGLGNSNHVITVPGISSVYTYTVTAQPGETVSFILSDVREADEDGEEREGQRAVWMATAVSPPPSQGPSEEPSGEPSGNPSTTPSGEPSGEPSGNPSQQPSDQPSDQPTASASDQPSGEPSASAQPSGNPSVQPSDQPTTSGNPSPTIAPSDNQGGSVGGGSGTITDSGSSGGSSGGTFTGGSSSSGGSMPRTGDIGHFWALLGIIGVLIVIVVVAGKRVFAEED